jgi:hypothetical protein
MRIKLTSILAVILLSVAAEAQKKEVVIRIVQDDPHVLDSYHTEITLKRKTFKIQVLLQGVKGIYSFAGFTDSICCKVEEADTIPGFSLYPDLTMNEVEFNKEKELLVGERNCSYWYYDPALSHHRFNKKVVQLDSNRFVGVKTIKQVLYVPTREEIKIKDLRTPLYLFFVAVDEFDPEGRPVRELMRRRVKINWSHEED